VIPLKYKLVWPFAEGLAAVELTVNGKKGFIDKTGKEVISLKYDSAHSFSKGLAEVTLNGSSGFIGRDGTEYFEP